MSSSEIDVDDGPAFAAACAPLVASLGGGWMISPQAKAFAKEHGLRGRQGYVIGRGSVLGDVDADVVTAAFGFWPADIIREAWDAAREVLDVPTALRDYAEACRAWGRERYADLAGRRRVSPSCSGGSSTAPTSPVSRCSPAGARCRCPTTTSARLNQQLHVLREYRGGMHLVAVVASGLSPLQAVLSGPGGPGNAAFFGWEEPFEDVDRPAAGPVRGRGADRPPRRAVLGRPRPRRARRAARAPPGRRRSRLRPDGRVSTAYPLGGFPFAGVRVGVRPWRHDDDPS